MRFLRQRVTSHAGAVVDVFFALDFVCFHFSTVLHAVVVVQ